MSPAGGTARRHGGRTLAYQYLVLRAVPRVDREEFLNVGVVLYSQDADVLDCLWRVDPGRLRAVDPGLDVPALERALTAVAAVCTGAAGPARTRPGARFGWIAAPRSTVLQPGPVHGGITADPRAELERLRARLVDVRD